MATELEHKGFSKEQKPIVLHFFQRLAGYRTELYPDLESSPRRLKLE